MLYELFYLVGASKEADLEKIKKEVSDIAISEGAKFEEKQVVEKRKMAYEIRHENRGFYVAQRFELEDPEKIKAMTKKLNLYSGILRFMITHTDELPELTSREEREVKSKSESRVEARKSESKREAAPTKPVEKIMPAEEKKEETEEKKRVDEEDIDKKLEEILNI